MRRLWRRLWDWLQGGGTSHDWEREKDAFDREHAARLDEAARIERQQQQIVQRLRALGFEVEVYRHTQDREDQ